MRHWKYLISAGKYLATLCGLVFLGCLTIQFSILQHIKFPVIRKEVDVATNEDLIAESQYGTRFQVEFGNPDNYDTQYDNNRRHKERLKAVVIVASFRTGSSFVGQLFNQHPGVFYLFEPLYYSIWQRPSGLSDSQVIEDVLLCNTTSMLNENHRAWIEARRDFSEDRSLKNFKKMKEIEKCLIGGLCFRHKSEALCTRKMCRNETAANCRFCAAPSPSLMQEACEHSRVRVLKVIRVEDLETLKRSWNHMNIDLRIIHLVRDPRSTLLSRLRLTKPASNVADVVSSTCERNYKIHSQFLGNETRHRWLKGIYKLVRYEDIIENPILQTRKLYDFLNFLDFTPDKNVIEWIENSIGSNDFSLFGTSRNLEMQKYKWRRQIPLRFAISVQEKCSEMMAMFRYKNVTSNIQLLNMGEPLMEELH